MPHSRPTNSIYPCCIYRFILPFYLITHGLILYSNSHFNQSLKLFSKMDESIQKDLASAQDMGWFNSNLNLMIPRSSPPRGVLRKRCSKNMQQIYRTNPWRSVISIKLLYNFTEITLRHRCSPVNKLHIFRTSFPRNTFGWLLLDTMRIFGQTRDKFE